MISQDLVLASSSIYRQMLLDRLRIPYQSVSPDIDETALNGESPVEQVQRLSKLKAERVAQTQPNALIIASDQLATVNNLVLGKPGNHGNAVTQLKQISGQTVVFHTGLCVLHHPSQRLWLENVEYRVVMRKLSDQQISRYLAQEEPYDCAGSFKSEGYGISLFLSMHGDDPTALIGLPLIRLSHILCEAGIPIP